MEEKIKKLQIKNKQLVTFAPLEAEPEEKSNDMKVNTSIIL